MRERVLSYDDERLLSYGYEVERSDVITPAIFPVGLIAPDTTIYLQNIYYYCNCSNLQNYGSIR